MLIPSSEKSVHGICLANNTNIETGSSKNVNCDLIVKVTNTQMQ